MKLESRLEKLEAQKIQIQKEIEVLRGQRVQEIASSLQHMDLKDTDTFTVVGCLLWLLGNQHDKNMLEEWRRAGRKFCAAYRPKSTKALPASPEKKAA